VRACISGGFLTDAGLLFDAEKVLLLCLFICKCGHSISQLLQGLECCVRYAMTYVVDMIQLS